MSGLSTVRAAIVATLAGVPDIGRVHDRERIVQADGAVREHYGFDVGGPKLTVRGWFVRLREFSGVQARIGRGRRITAIWDLVGFIGLVDDGSSQILAEDLVQAASIAFDANPRLGGAVNRCAVGDGDEAPAGIQCDSIVPVRLAGVAVHRVILSLPTQHFAS